MTATIIGIDLGTTNSAVAIVKERQPTVLDHQGERLLPSVVAHAAGKWLVGTPARNQYALNPENTARSIKRKMGTGEKVTLGGHELTPPQVSAFILRRLQSIAQKHTDGEITDAVITVPAYFSDAQRQATRDAGRIAGLNVRRIINEPTAAALAYGLNLEEDKLALVYDLGGGTFDVSLVELMGGVVEVLASHGNTQLGGDDFDELLAGHLADLFAEEHDVDLRADRRAWARLQRTAEQVKIELSTHPFAWAKEEYLAEKDGVPLHLEEEISRATFIELIDDLLDETIDSIEEVFTAAEIEPEDLDQVLMVGGSTRIPAVWERIADYTGLEPLSTVNPDEAVALGAAVQGAIIAGEPIDAILVDVTPHSLGIAVAEQRGGRLLTDRYKTLIHRNTTIPVTAEELFHTLHPDQDAVQIKVHQGEESVASKNELLGEFLIEGLVSPAPGELASVTVRFDFDVDGILHVTARDRHSETQADLTVSATRSRLKETEIDAAKTMLADTETADDDAGVSQALVKRVETLLQSDDLDQAAKTELEGALAEFQHARKHGQASRLEALSDELLDLLFDYED